MKSANNTPAEVACEAAARTNMYPKEISLENSMFQMNHALAEQTSYNQDLQQETPLLLIIGLPRSGTTLLSQAMARYFDIGFIDKIAARFWLDPVTGIRLSRHISDELAVGSFQSSHGKSSNINEPHEFAYFWQHWLLGTSTEPYDYLALRDEIKWAKLKTVILNMQKEFQGGLMMKALWTNYHLECVSKLFTKVCFVYIKRNAADVCISLRDARNTYYDDPNKWWSLYPDPDYYSQLKDLEYQKQIPAQIAYLTELIEPHINNINSFTINYSELCEAPNEVMHRLVAHIRETTGCSMTIQDELPQQFDFVTYRNKHDGDYYKFEKNLEKLEIFSRNIADSGKNQAC